VKVRRNQQRLRKQSQAKGVDGGGRDQRRAVLADHHWIDNKRRAANRLRDGFNDRRRAQRAGLGRARRDIAENGRQLLAN